MGEYIMTPEKKETLYVKMFGQFSMLYNGESLLGRRTGESQFISLMQLLLHNRKNGISRETAEEVLFGNRDVENPHHALRSVVYNAKKRLEKAGLPKCTYIVAEKGMLYWTDKIPVESDTEKFEELYKKAQETKDDGERLKILAETTQCYVGEFLKLYSNTVWIAVEARRYRVMFNHCVEEIVSLLRAKQNYTAMERIGRYAAETAPLCDWESVVMEALLGMGKYEDANRYYSDTVNKYFEEKGMQPFKKLTDTLQLMENQFAHPYNALEKIQEGLNESCIKQGPYVCSYPVFQGIYQMLNRLARRSGQPMCLMLCTIVDSKGVSMKEGKQLDELSDRLMEAIRKSIRRSDVVNRYGKGQYLILLMNVDSEDCGVIQKRINSHFLTGRQRTGVSYCISNVLQDE